MQRDALHICVSTLFSNPFEITPDHFDAAIDACVDAGFDGVSLWSLHHAVLGAAGRSGDDIARAFAARNLDVSCIEAIYGWANAPDTAAALADAEPSLLLCQLHGAPNLAAVLLGDSITDIAQAVANLAAVADRAAQVGATVCIEYLPWTGIPDLGTVWDLIVRAERENVGIMFDSWHWHWQPGGPSGPNAELLASIPGGRIPVFQLCDSLPEPTDDPMTACMSSRPLPGDGVVDHDALFALFREIGADPVVAPEVFNAALVATGSLPAAQAIAESSRRILGRW